MQACIDVRLLMCGVRAPSKLYRVKIKLLNVSEPTSDEVPQEVVELRKNRSADARLFSARPHSVCVDATRVCAAESTRPSYES